MSRRWVLYSYDALGLGHVRRSLALARAVLAKRPDLATLLITCSPMVDALPVPPGLDYIKLPSARKLGNQRYGPRSLPIDSAHFSAFRSALVREAVEQFDPELLLVDKAPAGMMGELLETLERARRRGRPARRVLGMRDILDEPSIVAEEWKAQGLISILDRHYDEVWIYGDRALFDAAKAYEWPKRVASRVRYLGYLVPTPDAAARNAARARYDAQGERLAVVTVGGGEDGAEVIAAYLRAAELRLLPPRLRSVVVLGPCMPADQREALGSRAPDGVRIESFIPDLGPVIAAADVVVGMAGYNTVCELLAAGTPAVLVPRVRPRREQWLRARALATRGLAELVEPDTLEPRTLADGIRRALERGRMKGNPPAADGLAQFVGQVDRLVPGVLPALVAAGSRRPGAPDEDAEVDALARSAGWS